MLFNIIVETNILTKLCRDYTFYSDISTLLFDGQLDRVMNGFDAVEFHIRQIQCTAIFFMELIKFALIFLGK